MFIITILKIVEENYMFYPIIAVVTVINILLNMIHLQNILIVLAILLALNSKNRNVFLLLRSHQQTIDNLNLATTITIMVFMAIVVDCLLLRRDSRISRVLLRHHTQTDLPACHLTPHLMCPHIQPQIIRTIPHHR